VGVWLEPPGYAKSMMLGGSSHHTLSSSSSYSLLLNSLKSSRVCVCVARTPQHLNPGTTPPRCPLVWELFAFVGLHIHCMSP
jgi:hypothetical protein